MYTLRWRLKSYHLLITHRDLYIRILFACLFLLHIILWYYEPGLFLNIRGTVNQFQEENKQNLGILVVLGALRFTEWEGGFVTL